MGISNLCRSCMKEVASWECENFNSRAVEMFSFITNIQISDDEKLPKQFCYDCIIKIESSFIYITETQKVDVILKNIISRTNKSIIVEPEINKNLDIQLNSPDSDVMTIKDEKEINDTSIVDDISQMKSDFKEMVTVDKKHKFQKSNLMEITDIEKIKARSIVEDFLAPINDISLIETGKQISIENDTEHLQDNNTKEVDNIEEIKKHVCAICRKQFSSKLWFNRHMKNEHKGQKFICEHCQKSYSKQWELKQHLFCHTDERRHSCSVCGKCFKRRNQLCAHKRVHVDHRPFACDKCGMKFKFKSALKSHMTVHDGEKQYLCSFCGWSFAQAGNLEVHIRKHTGVKPYSCNECNFRSTVASSLKRHQRRHRQAKIYVCKHCSKGFYDHSGLSRHIRIHTGELPYKCPVCARGFVDSWKRKTHLMRAHRLELNDIPSMRRDGTAIQ